MTGKHLDTAWENLKWRTKLKHARLLFHRNNESIHLSYFRLLCLWWFVTQQQKNKYNISVAAWVSCEADSGMEISIQEMDWVKLLALTAWWEERNKIDQREKLACTIVPVMALVDFIKSSEIGMVLQSGPNTDCPPGRGHGLGQGNFQQLNAIPRLNWQGKFPRTAGKTSLVV